MIPAPHAQYCVSKLIQIIVTAKRPQTFEHAKFVISKSTLTLFLVYSLFPHITYKDKTKKPVRNYNMKQPRQEEPIETLSQILLNIEHAKFISQGISSKQTYIFIRNQTYAIHK